MNPGLIYYIVVTLATLKVVGAIIGTSLLSLLFIWRVPLTDQVSLSRKFTVIAAIFAIFMTAIGIFCPSKEDGLLITGLSTDIKTLEQVISKGEK